MLEDVQLSVYGQKPVEFHGRMGGEIPTVEDIVKIVALMLEKYDGENAIDILAEMDKQSRLEDEIEMHRAIIPLQEDDGLFKM